MVVVVGWLGFCGCVVWWLWFGGWGFVVWWLMAGGWGLVESRQLDTKLQPVYMATDGGADGVGLAQKGAFAVVTGDVSVSGIQPGHDQSAPATEQWAAYQAVWAVRESGVASGRKRSRSTSSSTTS